MDEVLLGVVKADAEVDQLLGVLVHEEFFRHFVLKEIRKIRKRTDVPMDKWSYGQTDRLSDVQMDRQTDGYTDFAFYQVAYFLNQKPYVS